LLGRTVGVVSETVDFQDPTDVLLGHTVRSDSGTTDYLFESKLGVGGTAAAYLARRIEQGGSSPYPSGAG
jgi:hypothetical protein